MYDQTMRLKESFILQLMIGLVFVVSGLIINFIQLLTCVLWPINKSLYRRINVRLAYSLCSQLVVVLDWWSGTECNLYADEKLESFGKEHAIIILNHNYELDFLCGWTICERYGVLGSSKVLAKHELLKVPLIGWTWYFIEMVFCKRNWAEDKKAVINGLNNLKDFPEKMWVLLYCEGTRFTEKKHQISMEVADSKGLPRLKHHLLPRTKGFTTTLHCLRDTVSAVYDVTLNFRDGKVPSLADIVKGRQFKADLYVRRIPVEEIPEDEKECADWVHKLYQEKDALQEGYFTTGRFPGNLIPPPRRLPWALFNLIFWTVLLLSPLVWFAVGVVTSGNPLLILGLLVLLVVASVAVKKLISVSDVKKTGSSYGVQESKKET